MADNIKYSFSGIISVLDGEKYLKETLESIKNQDINLNDIQMILIDDGSTDTTLEIMKSYEDAFGKVDIVSNDTNMGVGYSFNLGLSMVEGEYTFFFGGDDLLSENVLSEVYKFFSKNDVEMISVFIKRFGEDSLPMFKDERFVKGNRVIDVTKEHIYPQILNGGCFFRSDALKDYRYNEKLNHFSDGDFMLRFVEDYKRYAVLNTATIYYRIKSVEESLSKKTKKTEYIYTVIMKESLIKLVEYSKERNNGVVSKYMQTALTHRLAIFIRRTKIMCEFTKEDRLSWLKDTKYILDEIEPEIILENYTLNLSEKNIMLNMKNNEDLFINNFSYKNNKFYYNGEDAHVSLRDSFKVKTIEDEEKIHIKVISDFFLKEDITVNFKRKNPFKKGTFNKIREWKKTYYFEGYEPFNTIGCTLNIIKIKPFYTKSIYVYVKGKKLKFDL